MGYSVWDFLGNAIGPGIETGMAVHRTQQASREREREFTERETERTDRLKRIKKEDEDRDRAFLTSLNEQFTARSDARRKQTGSGKMMRKMLESTKRGRDLLLNMGTLSDEDMGDPNALRTVDDVMRYLQDPKPEPWKPSTREEQLDFDDEKLERDLKLRRKYPTPRAAAGDDGNDPASILRSINPVVAAARQRVDDFKAPLDRHSKAMADYIPALGGPPPTLAPSDTAGYGAAQREFADLSRLQTGALRARVTGQAFDARSFFSNPDPFDPNSTNSRTAITRPELPGLTPSPWSAFGQPVTPPRGPAASAAPPAPAPGPAPTSLPGLTPSPWSAFKKEPDSRESQRDRYARRYEELVGQGMNPDAAKATVDAEFGRGRGIRR